MCGKKATIGDCGSNGSGLWVLKSIAGNGIFGIQGKDMLIGAIGFGALSCFFIGLCKSQECFHIFGSKFDGSFKGDNGLLILTLIIIKDAQVDLCFESIGIPIQHIQVNGPGLIEPILFVVEASQIGPPVPI